MRYIEHDAKGATRCKFIVYYIYMYIYNELTYHMRYNEEINNYDRLLFIHGKPTA